VKTILDIVPHHRVLKHLEAKLRDEESNKGRYVGTCDCEFKQRCAGGICAECLRGCIAEMKAGIGDSTKVNAEVAPVPDGIYLRGKGMKKNLENNA
jgi:hypothetical protein